MQQQRNYGQRTVLPIFQAAADATKWPPELEEGHEQGDLGPQWMVWISGGH